MQSKITKCVFPVAGLGTRFLPVTKELAKEMLAKHIRDQNEAEDNTALLEKKRAELSKLEKRLTNLISMRADGEIDKQQFQQMKAKIDAQMQSLQEQISKLSPPESETTEEIPDYSERITMLRRTLERNLDFSTDADIPEQVIEAFIGKIVVRENTFDWYLLYSASKPIPQYMKIGEFTLDRDDAKAYLYAKSKKHRILNWRDLFVNVYI